MIYLVYKDFVQPGGAERLIAKELLYFKRQGLDCKLLVNTATQHMVDLYSIDQSDLKCLSGGPIQFILKLIRLAKSNDFFLVSSGDIFIWLASLLNQKIRYGLHIHHPIMMSLGDVDKFASYAKNHYNETSLPTNIRQQYVDIWNEKAFKERLIARFRQLFSYLAKRRSIISFVLSDYAKNEKAKVYGINSIVLYGALDQVPEKIKSKSKNSNQIQLVTLARLDRNKRLDILISWLAEMRRDVFFNLKIIGSGPERDSLQEQIYQLGLEDQVELTGFLQDNEVAKIYDEADIFVSIDMADYKITMFEALASGLPVIVTRETEVSDALLATNYVRQIDLSCRELNSAIKALTFNHVSRSPERLRCELSNVVWQKYFSDISRELKSIGFTK